MKVVLWAAHLVDHLVQRTPVILRILIVHVLWTGACHRTHAIDDLLITETVSVHEVIIDPLNRRERTHTHVIDGLFPRRDLGRDTTVDAHLLKAVVVVRALEGIKLVSALLTLRTPGRVLSGH